jgi:hypothetical protein
VINAIKCDKCDKTPLFIARIPKTPLFIARNPKTPFLSSRAMSLDVASFYWRTPLISAFLRILVTAHFLRHLVMLGGVLRHLVMLGGVLRKM